MQRLQTERATITAKTVNGKTATCTVTVTDPQKVTISSLTCNEDGITIKWNAVSGAASYKVYYKSTDGTWKAFSSNVVGTSKLDTGVQYNRRETYSVVALNSSGDAISQFDSTGKSVVYSVANPQITSLKSDENGITIKWNKISGVSTYRVYYKNSDGGWSRFKDDITGTTKLDTGVKFGRAETYTIRAVNKKGDLMSGFKSEGWTTTYGVATPQITSLKCDENGITIKWSAVSGASVYRVYYKNANGEWARFKDDVTGRTKLDTGVKYGRAETYTVRAVNKNGDVMSDFVGSGWTTTYGVSTPKITSLKNTSNGIQITWSKVSGVSTYRVYYKNSEGEWARFKDDITGTTKLDTGVKAGREETYTIRAVDVNGNLISDYDHNGWSIVYN